MEDLVKGDLLRLLKGRGIEVVRVLSRVPYYRSDGREAGEVDLIAINGEEVVAVEVKTTLTSRDVETFLARLQSFKHNFAEYRSRTVYGAVAFLDKVEDGKPAIYAQNQGLYTIKAPGGDASVAVIENASDFRPKAF